jgi:hypothetical protein
MSKRILFVLAALFYVVCGFSQIALEPSVIASGGSYAESESMSISWTLGELVTTTLTGGDMILTQGFQQPIDFGTGISPQELNWGITAYPNPVGDELNVRFDIDRTRDFWIEIQDVTGRVLSLEQHKEVFPADVFQINTSNFTYGVYFLKVFTPDREQSQVLSIRKL